MHQCFKNAIVAATALSAASFIAIGARAGEDPHKQAALVSAEISTIARHLSMRPKTAIDFSTVSNEYCFFTGWDKHHTHYAIDPGITREDNIDFVDARPLIAAGFVVEQLPPLPKDLGQMEPGQWYLVAEGEHEPHHGMTAKFPLLLRATNLE